MLRFCVVVLLTLTITTCSQPPRIPVPRALPSPLPSALPTSSPLPTLTPTAPPTATVLPTVAATATELPTSLPAPTELALTASDTEQEARMLVLINALRAENGLPPYVLDAGLSAVARAHSCDMAANSFIDHVSSNGQLLQDRIPVVDPPWIWPSESIAAGSEDAAAIIALWMDEPPDGWHRRNLLDPDQQAIGVGYCFRDDDPTGNRYYWTIDLARH